MPQFTSKVAGLRIYLGGGKSVKFVAGKFSTDSEQVGREISAFAKTHPVYGITSSASEKTKVAPLPVQDLSGMSYADLQFLAKERGMKASGSRDILLARLTEE